MYKFLIFLILLILSTIIKKSNYVNSSSSINFKSEDTLRISLLFMGDIMQHKPQIDAAWDDILQAYSYDTCFHYIEELFTMTDFCIANLELTLGGPPYTGYPQFSAPDQLGYAIKNSGINVLVTANNHSCDRGKKGIIRTIQIIDSLQIHRTGTFLDSTDYYKNHLLILEKNGLRITLLNYTYGTNGLPIPSPTIVNLIDTNVIKKDIDEAKKYNPDEIIVYFHWGNEYERLQNKSQTQIAEVCIRNGARIVIGSHPHVVQPMHYIQNPYQPLTHAVIIYSLGNFISNQRKLHRDGGAVIYIRLKKIGHIVEIDKIGYLLTWVFTPVKNNKKYFFIVPISKYEHKPEMFDSLSYASMMQYAKETRLHLKQHNIGIEEIKWCEIQKKWLIY